MSKNYFTTSEDVIYIFLHVTKSGGTTLGHHIRNSLPNDAQIALYYGWEYPSFVGEKGKRIETDDDVEHILESLSDAQKDKIRVVYGHRVYYGIHRHFNKKARYITFLRNPIDREISMYNFRRKLLDDVLATPEKKMSEYSSYLRDCVLVDMIIQDRILPFEEWLSHSSWHSNFVSKTLIDRKFGTDEDPVEHLLNTFYFVGITERSAIDNFYFYYLLKIKDFFSNQNISLKYTKRKQSPDIEARILQKNQKDLALYTAACKRNAADKKWNPGFFLPVWYMKGKRMLHKQTS